MDVRVGLWRKLSAKKLMLLNCGVGETLESPLDCKEIQPVHPKEISPGYSLKGLMLNLKLQYFGHLMWRVDSLEKTLMLGGIGAGEGDDRGWDDWMASPTRWTWVWVNSGSWWWTGRPGMLGVAKSQTRLSDWTELRTSQVRKDGGLHRNDMHWKKQAFMKHLREGFGRMR